MIYRGRRPVLIPLIRVAVRLRVPHPLAYGLLSRHSSTHHTHTDIADFHPRNENIDEWGRFVLVSIVCETLDNDRANHCTFGMFPVWVVADGP